MTLEEELNQKNSLNNSNVSLENRYRSGDINANFSFRNFVVGKSNRFAFQMALKVADQPGAVANPFYIFGDVGLGKTHLMQAIGNYIDTIDNLITLHQNKCDELKKIKKFMLQNMFV